MKLFDDGPDDRAEDEARLDALARGMRDLTGLSEGLSRSLQKTFTDGVTHGRSFETVLRNIGVQLQDLVLKAALKPATGLLSNGLDMLMSKFSSGLTGALLGGSAPSGGAPVRAMPFAKGGVVASPTYFPLSGGLGVAGEAGAEAILPLARGADGRLGVRAEGGGRAPVVNVTISTPDAESFRRSEAQVAAALARAVARGRRAM